MRTILHDTIDNNGFSYVCQHCGYSKKREYKGLEIKNDVISLGQCTNCEKSYIFLLSSDSETPEGNAVKKIFSAVKLLMKGN